MSLINISNKFQRTYFLQIQGNDGNTYSIGSENGLSQYLSLEFSIRRDILASANTGSFRIRNINSSVRGQIYQDWYNIPNQKQMILKAGYIGTPLSTIFKGLINSATSYREEGGTDVITEIEGHDYSMSMALSTSNLSLSSSPTQQQVIAALVADLQSNSIKLNQPLGIGLISSYPGTHYGRYNNIGNTWQLLQTETQRTCYIDSGLIYCIPNNITFPGTVTIISSDTGLLGTPRLYHSYLLCEMLFEPGIIPGQSVFLDTSSLSQFSSFFNGTYKVTSVSHYGTISPTVGGKCKTLVTLQLTVNQLQESLQISIPTGVLPDGTA